MLWWLETSNAPFFCTEDTTSRSGSSISSGDQEESDAETVKDSTKDEKAGQPKEDHREEAAAPNDQSEEPKPEETAATKVETTRDSSATPGRGDKQGGDTSEDKNYEETENESRTDDEQDRGEFEPLTKNE